MSAPLRNRRPPAPGPQGPIPPVSNMDLGGLRRYASTVGMEHPQQWAGRPTPWGLTDAERTANVLRQQSSADRPLDADPAGELLLTAGVQSAPSLARALGRRIVRPVAAPAPAPRPAPAVDDDLAPLASMDAGAGQQAAEDIWWRNAMNDVRAEQTAIPFRPGLKPPGEEGLAPLPPLYSGATAPGEIDLPPLPSRIKDQTPIVRDPDATHMTFPSGAKAMAEPWMMPEWKAKWGHPDAKVEAAYDAANARLREIKGAAQSAGVDTSDPMWRGRFMSTSAGQSAPTEMPYPTMDDFIIAAIKSGRGVSQPPAPAAPVVPVPRMMQTAVGRRR